MSIIIAKNGKQIMELAQVDGLCTIVKRYKNGVVHTVVSTEKFGFILDGANDNGCDIYCYYD